MPFDQCWVQKFSASNLFLLAPRVANSAWAGSACMSKTDAQSGPVALSKLKCCKNSNLDGKTMEHPPHSAKGEGGVPHWKFSLSHVFLFLVIFLLSFFLNIKHHYPQNHSKKCEQKKHPPSFLGHLWIFSHFWDTKNRDKFFGIATYANSNRSKFFATFNATWVSWRELSMTRSRDLSNVQKKRDPGCLRDLFGGITDYTQLWGEYNKSPINHYIRIPFKTR